MADGIQSAPQRAVNVPIEPLATPAAPVVTPSATAALGEAFRSGIVTSADIMERFGERGKLKEKAEIQLLSEQTSPEAVATRQSAMSLQRKEVEFKEAELKYGPGIKLFQTLAPEFGIIETPMLKNGKPDYAKMAEQGLLMAAKKTRKQAAIERLKPVPGMSEKGTDEQGRTVLFMFNEAGEHITPELESILRPIAKAPLSLEDIKPGTAAVAAATEAPTKQTLGQAIPGQGIVIGAKQAPKPPTPRDPAEVAREITTLDALQRDVAEAKSIVGTRNVVGPAIGTAPVRAATRVGAAVGIGGSEQLRIDQRKLEILRSQRVLQGAQQMKGNLSDKDIRFLQDTVPQLADDETVWNDYLDKWSQMIDANKKVLRGELPVGYSVLDTTGAIAPGTAAPSAVKESGQIIDVRTIEDVQNLPSGARARFPDGSVSEPLP